MSTYPEHDKLTAIAPESQIIGEFLEWINQECSIFLARVYTFKDGPNEAMRTEMAPWMGQTEDLLAQFFKIDRDALMKEKSEMLHSLRIANGETA